MTKFITILFLAVLFWLFMFSTADAIATMAIYIDKAIRRFVKKRRYKI